MIQIIKISVITATWNCANTVVDCLNSVRCQTYTAREHVVIDGASSDGTLELLESNADGLSILISEQDYGIYDALNKGIKLSSGDIVGFLHSDDLYAHSDILTNIAATFEANPDICAVYGDLQYVNKEDTSAVVRYWKSSPFSSKRLAWGWMPPIRRFM